MSPSGPVNPSAAPKARRLSYREQRELAQLPEKIQNLEAEQAQLTGLISAPTAFQRNKDQGSEALQRLQVLAEELDSAYARWEMLDRGSGAT
jgi:ATP-binding cassette subfamily F protein uup